MANEFEMQRELLNKRADLKARLNLLPYDGTPEVKKQGDAKYLYIRKREAGRLSSTYVGAYSDTLYDLLLKNAAEAKAIRREMRKIERKLVELGYAADELPERVLQNIDFARANMKANIYDQAVLEGVATSFPQTRGLSALKALPRTNLRSRAKAYPQKRTRAHCSAAKCRSATELTAYFRAAS